MKEFEDKLKSSYHYPHCCFKSMTISLCDSLLCILFVCGKLCYIYFSLRSHFREIYVSHWMGLNIIQHHIQLHSKDHNTLTPSRRISQTTTKEWQCKLLGRVKLYYWRLGSPSLASPILETSPPPVTYTSTCRMTELIIMPVYQALPATSL